MGAKNPTSQLGALYLGARRCSFLVWAPEARHVELCLTDPEPRQIQLEPRGNGYFGRIVDHVDPGASYTFRLDAREDRADPASRFQPSGVHGPSAVCDPAFDWQDRAWLGVPLRDYILYEVHVGTFTREGTFDAIIPHLPSLVDLGVTALELMPVAQFPGSRNWGYDGVFPFAVQNSYGGPAGLKRLVNACHQAGLAVVLDVVYNHLGPEGNYLRHFGPYFSDCYKTPWGSALNFDGEFSGEVRRFFIENALYWQTEFHVDALRLDAIHTMRDFSATPFLQDLARATHRRAEKSNRRFYLIAESDLNDVRYILPETSGGVGLHAQWSDDFHHCLHTLITGERHGYYADFGGLDLLAKAFREGYVYTGQYSVFRKRNHGNSPRLAAARQFVVFSQNHDQVGNRLGGDRLSTLASLEALKLAAGAVILSPFIPLLFMGEEYGEPAPFQYVVSHSDPELIEAVRRGRREEFAGFGWRGEIPDPFAERTFNQCVLTRETCRTGAPHSALHDFYRDLIRLRKELPALADAEKDSLQVDTLLAADCIRLWYKSPVGDVLVFFCFAKEPCVLSGALPPGSWMPLLDSTAKTYAGPGPLNSRPLRENDQVHLQPTSLLLLHRTQR